MNQPDLHQSSISRGLSDTARIVRSPVYGFAVGSLTVLSGLTAFLTTSSSTEARIIVPIIAGLATVLVALLGTFIVRWIAAPYVQRNDLRRAWPNEPIRRPVDVELSLREMSRKGVELATWLGKLVAWTEKDRRSMNDWADNAVAFLTEHVPQHAREFIDLPVDGSEVQLLHARALKLREFADELS